MSRSTVHLRLSAAAGALALAVPAQAQDTPAPAPAADLVVTAAGVPQDAATVGQAVTVIDRATIERRQTVSVSDLLSTTPGVTVSRNGGVGALTAVRIRGAEGEQTLTLIDGVRVNDPSSPGGAFDFANLLAGSVDRIEVLRGANSVPWGSQAIGGVVNVVTMRPTPGLAARGNVEYGSYDSWFANAGVSGSTGIVSGALTGGYLKTDGVSAAAGGPEPDGYRQYGATGRVEVAFTPNIRLDLRGYYADSRIDIDGYPAPDFVLADTPQYSASQELYGYAGLNADLFDGRFHNRIAFTVADINRDNFAAKGTSPASWFRGRSERYEYQGDIRIIDQVRLVGGAEHEDTRYRDSGMAKGRGLTSVYGEAIVTPVERLTVTGGVRWLDDSQFGDHLVWSANGAYALPTGTTLRASYAEGFKAPTLYQLYAPFYGNATLIPETSQGYDVGIEQKLVDGRIVASVTWFHRDTTNQITSDPNTFVSVNLARTRTKGVEVGLGVKPTDQLQLSGTYTFIDARGRTDDGHFDGDLLRRPRQAVSASVDWQSPVGLNVGATVQNVGASLDYDSFGSIVRLKNYVLAGLRAELPINRNLSIYGRVDNLFDEQYQVAAEYGTLGRAAYGGIRVKLD